MTDVLDHRRRPPRPLRVVLTTIKAGAVGVLVGLLVALGLSSLHAAGSAPVADQADQTGQTGPAADAVLERAMTSQQCSSRGFGDTTVPASALIRTPRGEVRVVSFDRGWDAFQGRRPGTLVAVCLREPPRR